MKTLKLSTLLVALASVFTFSSCMDSDNESYGNVFLEYVTITGDSSRGYTFHDDAGCTLKPTASSIQTVLPGLAGSNVKRAIIACELVNDETTTQLEEGKTYEVNLIDYYGANIALPTINTIRRNENPSTAEADTLITKNNGILSVDSSKKIWAINGYVNAAMIINWDGGSTINMKAYYNASDIDIANNTLTLNIYYNSQSGNAYIQQVQSVFCFDLPEELYSSYESDEITIVMKAKNNSQDPTGSSELVEVGRCQMATKHLFQPIGD